MQKELEKLKNYSGKRLTLMEVCGSHTAAISKTGLREILPDNIELLSGPGCPVCVTTTGYIDELIKLSKSGVCVVSFGDLLRVPGREGSLLDAKADGGEVIMVYSPGNVTKLAKENPDKQYVFAAIGFETTIPVYALLLEELISEKIENVTLFTSLKTMPEAMEFIIENNPSIDGFLAPGHVAAVTGSDYFKPLAEKYNKKMVVAGFSAPELVFALGALIDNSDLLVRNFYPRVVTDKGNIRARALVDKYLEKADATWRGIGQLKNSGMVIREEYSRFDATRKYKINEELIKEDNKNKACRCQDVLLGKIKPTECPLFKKVCTRDNPVGACMVSEEGTCHSYL